MNQKYAAIGESNRITKQGRAGNRRALEDTLRRTEAFFSRHLRF